MLIQSIEIKKIPTAATAVSVTIAVENNNNGGDNNNDNPNNQDNIPTAGDTRRCYATEHSVRV